MTPDMFEGLLTARRSIRAYLPDPVGRACVADILRQARTAPSGANLQPGRFHALTGDALAGLASVLEDAVASGRPQVSEYGYFPKPLSLELRERQCAAGYALYRALGICRRDVAARKAQFVRNFRFFDAPVGIIVTIDRRMGSGCFMDLGMSIQSLLLAVSAKGLGACAIGAIAKYADVIHDKLDLDAGELVVCGIALGYAEHGHPANTVETERDPLTQFTSFTGFDNSSGDLAAVHGRPAFPTQGE